jgi:hypothetical protein
MLLVVPLGLEYTTTIDVTEELVTSPGNHVLFGHILLLLLPHGRRPNLLPEHHWSRQTSNLMEG